MRHGKRLAALLITTALILQTIPAYAFDGCKKGDINITVQALQMRLNALGYSVGTVDANYGNMTVEAVSSFQRDHGLEATGEVDEETWNALYGESVTISKEDHSLDVLLTAPFVSVRTEEDDTVAVLEVEGVKCWVDILTDRSLDVELTYTMRYFQDEYDTVFTADYQGSSFDTDIDIIDIDGHSASYYAATLDFVNGQELTRYIYSVSMELEDGGDQPVLVRAEVGFNLARGDEALITKENVIDILRRVRPAGEERDDAASAAEPEQTGTSDSITLPEYEQVEDGTNLMDLMDPILKYVDPAADGSDGIDGSTCVSMYYGSKIMKWYRSMVDAGNESASVLTEARLEIIVNSMDSELRSHYSELRERYAAAFAGAKLALEGSSAPYLSELGISDVTWSAEEVDQMEKAVLDGFDAVLKQ